MKIKMNSLSTEKKIIQEKSNQLIAEEMTLRDLRLALEKTQEDLALHQSWVKLQKRGKCEL